MYMYSICLSYIHLLEATELYKCDKQVGYIHKSLLLCTYLHMVMYYHKKFTVYILTVLLAFELQAGLNLHLAYPNHYTYMYTRIIVCTSLASQPYFSSCACAGERGRGKGRKNTSGKMCKVFVPSAGMLAEPMKFEHSK